MINLPLLCCFSNRDEINIMEKRCWISVGGPVILFLVHAGICVMLGMVLTFKAMQGKGLFLFLSGMIFLEQVLYIVWFLWEDSICLFGVTIMPFTVFTFFLPSFHHILALILNVEISKHLLGSTLEKKVAMTIKSNVKHIQSNPLLGLCVHLNEDIQIRRNLSQSLVASNSTAAQRNIMVFQFLKLPESFTPHLPAENHHMLVLSMSYT